MATILGTGWEHGSLLTPDLAQNGTLVAGLVTGSAYALQHTGRPGQWYSFKDFAVNPPYPQKAVHEIYGRAHGKKIGVNYTAHTIYQFKYSGSNANGTEGQCGIGWYNNKIALFDGNRGLVQAGAIVIPTNTEFLLEWYILFAGAVGVFITKINGAVDLNLINQNTARQGGGTTVADSIDLQIDVGGDSSFITDDLHIVDVSGVLNTWLGEGHYEALLPNAVGDITTLNNIVGSANHWDNVNDVPPNDNTDYNYDNTAAGTNDYDLYNLTDPANVGVIQGIMTWVRAMKDAAGVGNFRTVHKTHGVEYRDAVDIGLSTGWSYYPQARDVNPNTGIAWTAAELTALQAGFDAR